MTSTRKTRDEILDAARTCVEDFGVRRASLSDIARRARLSRPTVYRHWPDVNSLIADLLTRELRGIFASIPVSPPAATGRERLLEQVTAVVRELCADTLVTRILNTEPEIVATYAFQRMGASQQAALEIIEPHIREGQADRSIRDDDPVALAHVILLIAQSTVTSWRVVSGALSPEQLLEHIRYLLDGYLRPAAPAAD